MSTQLCGQAKASVPYLSTSSNHVTLLHNDREFLAFKNEQIALYYRSTTDQSCRMHLSMRPAPMTDPIICLKRKEYDIVQNDVVQNDVGTVRNREGYKITRILMQVTRGKWYGARAT